MLFWFMEANCFPLAETTDSFWNYRAPWKEGSWVLPFWDGRMSTQDI